MKKKIVDNWNYKLDGMLDKIEILIDRYNKLADETGLKKVVILIPCVIKDADKLYLQMFWVTLVAKILMGRW